MDFIKVNFAVIDYWGYPEYVVPDALVTKINLKHVVEIGARKTVPEGEWKVVPNPVSEPTSWEEIRDFFLLRWFDEWKPNIYQWFTTDKKVEVINLVFSNGKNSWVHLLEEIVLKENL